MNSSLSLFILPSPSFITSRKPSIGFSSWNNGSTKTLSQSGFSMLESTTLVRVATSLQGEQPDVTPNATSLTHLLSGSMSMRNNLNETKKPTEEATRGVNVVTIILVVCSCLLLWIIIIAIGLVKRRFEKRKENIGGRDGMASSELDRSHDSTSSMPLHLRARMIYQGLQSYEISNQVPNGVAHTEGRLSITPVGGPSRRESREHPSGYRNGLDVNGDAFRRTSDFNASTQVENNNNNINNGPGANAPAVRIVITEPSDVDNGAEVVAYDNEGISEDALSNDKDVSVDGREEQPSSNHSLPDTEATLSGTNTDREAADRQALQKEDTALKEEVLPNGEGVVNEGFYEEDGDSSEPCEQTTEL